MERLSSTNGRFSITMFDCRRISFQNCMGTFYGWTPYISGLVSDVRLRFSLESICWYLIGNSSNKDILFWGGSGGYLKNQPLEIRGYCRGVIHPNRWSPTSHGMDAWWSWTPSTYPSTLPGWYMSLVNIKDFCFFHPWWTPTIPLALIFGFGFHLTTVV